MKQNALSLKSIDPLFAKIETLSKVQRIFICVGGFALLIGAFAMLSFLPKRGEIKELKTKYEKLQKSLATAKRTALTKNRFEEKMKEVKVQFDRAKKALPEEKDIPSLLTDISKAGQDAGLEFLLFQPEKEIDQEFFTEIPIKIQVSGSYHQVAIFFDKVSRLSRIVNIKNIKMNASKKGSRLRTDCTAVTYRFVEAPQKPAVVAKKKDKKKKK